MLDAKMSGGLKDSGIWREAAYRTAVSLPS